MPTETLRRRRKGGTIALHCASPEQVLAFHDSDVAGGGTSAEDPPGPRKGSAGAVHFCYWRDPNDSKLCGIHRPA